MLFFSQPGPVETRRSYEELRDAGMQAMENGRLEDALELYDAALASAREREIPNLIDLAICNRSGALIGLGREKEVMSELRQILVRSTDPKTSSISAYYLSRCHEIIKDYKKGLFYGRIARDRALAAGSADLLVGSYNMTGSCLMADSFFAEAVAEYNRALALLPEERSIPRALVMTNLAYCQMMQDRVREGMSLSFQALRWLRCFGTRLYEVWPHLDLCYAYLDLDRLERARHHGARALEIAEETGEAVCLKNALFLLGETERMAGNYDLAQDHFSRLQQRFYPESPQIVDFMVQVGLRQVVNLRA